MKLERALIALALCGLAAAAPAQGWSPKRSVEIVVGFAAGGSQDQTARTVERLLVAGKLVNVPITVVNKPGASGSIGFTYVSQRPGDGHTLMVAGPSLVSGYIMDPARSTTRISRRSPRSTTTASRSPSTRPRRSGPARTWSSACGRIRSR